MFKDSEYKEIISKWLCIISWLTMVINDGPPYLESD